MFWSVKVRFYGPEISQNFQIVPFTKPHSPGFGVDLTWDLLDLSGSSYTHYQEKYAAVV